MPGYTIMVLNKIWFLNLEVVQKIEDVPEISILIQSPVTDLLVDMVEAVDNSVVLSWSVGVTKAVFDTVYLTVTLSFSFSMIGNASTGPICYQI